MCGITGIVRLREGPPPDPRLAERMASAIRHRGPDGKGVYADDRAALAVRRLAIVSPATGAQPIQSGAHVLLANAEVYDYAEMREDLRRDGAVFVGESDCEVLLHLLARDGPDGLAKVNGQFALALWDADAHRLLLARDPFGIAPLFYAEHADALIFGSEIKALLQHPDLDRSLDPAALDQVATFPGLVSPTTLFKNVRSLPPGCYLVADANGVRVRAYWDLHYPRLGDATVPDAAGEDDLVADLTRLIDRAVERRLQGESDVGVLLSGGLDSTLLAAVLRRLRPDATIRAYSAVFPGHSFDESRYQRAAAAAFRLTLSQTPFDAERIVRELPTMVAHAESPVRESYNVCTLALARAARVDGVKVLIGGEGADELFAGYPGYRMDRTGCASLLTGNLASDVADWANGGLRYEREYAAFSRQVRRLYAPAVREVLDQTDALAITGVSCAALRGRHIQHQRSYLDVKLRLGDHLLGDHGDRMTYASGVEPRFPFLDRDVAEFVRRTPPGLNIRGRVEKHLLRRVAERDVPAVLRTRPKYGFRGPGVGALLTNEWVRCWLSPERIRRDGWFDPAAVAALVASADASRRDLNPHVEDDLLMLVLSFNIFLDVFQSAPVTA